MILSFHKYLTSDALTLSLTFNAPIDQYTMSMGKRGAAKINFTAKSPEDQFKFRITIYSNGSSSIDVDMQNRESISFSGDLILPE